MRRHVDQRHERVLEIVQERGSLRLTELAEALGVSAVTVRRDVEALAAQGRLRRLHGAVVWPAGTPERPGPVPAPRAAAGLVLGMVVPSAEYYYAELVRGAQETVAARGGRLVVGISHYHPEEDGAQVRGMLETGVNGLLMVPSWPTGEPDPQTERWLRTLPVPAVLVERRAPVGSALDELDCVRSDHVRGAALAVRHLAALGHDEVALLLRESPTAPQVAEGHAAASAALGVRDPLPPIAMSPPADPAGLDRAVEHLCRAREERGVRAVLVHNDQDAIGVLQRLQARGLRVPRDLALVTYDDEMAALADPALTAVAPPKRAVGETAAGLLLGRLAERAGPGGESAAAPARPPRQVLLLPRLSVRQSCGTPVPAGPGEPAAAVVAAGEAN